MPINYAEKFSSQVDQRFTHGLLTAGLVNQNFEWVGVQTVKVFSRDLTVLNNYSLTGANRYGTPNELGNEVQEMQVKQDKSFTYTIDAKTEQDTNGTMEAAATLAENIDNVLIPAIDTYRLAVLVAKCPTAGSVTRQSHIITGAVGKTNAYEEFLKAQEILDNDLAPVGGRICICTPKYHNLIKLDPNFTKSGDLATKIALNGMVGEFDGVPVIKAPSRYFPTNVDFIITNPIAMPAPIKMQEYKINFNAPGISGALVEARFRHDAFVLNKKADAIAVHMSAAATFTAVTNPTGNPAQNGYYEKDGSNYFMSGDTEVDGNKTYYTRD